MHKNIMLQRRKTMTRTHSFDFTAIGVRHRHLFALSLIAGFLLVAESLAIHQSPHQHQTSSYVNDANCVSRRRSPTWRLGHNVHESSSSTLLMASSQSQSDTSTDNEIVNGLKPGEVEAVVKNTSLQSTPPTENTTASTPNTNKDEEEFVSIWPKMDELDKRMIKIALPCIANFAINPLIGAVDLLWINQMVCS